LEILVRRRIPGDFDRILNLKIKQSAGRMEWVSSPAYSLAPTMRLRHEVGKPEIAHIPVYPYLC
jgi:hypothetical protein